MLLTHRDALERVVNPVVLQRAVRGSPPSLVIMPPGVCALRRGLRLLDHRWQGAVIDPLLPRTAQVLAGRPHVYPSRLIIDTISYVLVGGCAWRLVPHDVAPWSIAYQWFRAWTADGTWNRVQRGTTGSGTDRLRARPPAFGRGAGLPVGPLQRGRRDDRLRRANGFAAANATCSSTPSGCCCGWWCTRRRCRTALGPSSYSPGHEPRFPRLGLVRVDGGYVNAVDAGLVGWAARHVGTEVVAVHATPT